MARGNKNQQQSHEIQKPFLSILEVGTETDFPAAVEFSCPFPEALA